MINRIFRAALTAMLIADLAEVISSITDGMLTGHCLGPACMAAYGIVKPFYSITGIISAILSSGALTLSAHYVGKGDARKTNQLFSLTVFLGIALSAALAVAGIVFAQPLARAMGANDELLHESGSYLAGLFTGVPAIVMGNILTVFLQLEGKYRNVTVSVIVTATVNIAGDLLAIYCLNGGMTGIGLATSAGYYAALVILIVGCRTAGSHLRFRIKDVRWKLTGDIFLMGLPKAAKRVCNVIRPVIINHTIMTVGGKLAMSAFSVQGSTAEFTELLGTCCGDVVVLMCGIFFGEENEEDMHKTLKLSFKYLLLGVVPVAVLSFVFAPQIAGFYLGQDKEAVIMAVLCLQIYAFKLPFLAFNEIFMNYFQALGKVKRTDILSVLQRLVYVVLCVTIMGSIRGVTGIWLAFPVSEALLSLTIVIIVIVHAHRFPSGLKDMMCLEDGFGKDQGDHLVLQMQSTSDAIRASESAGAFCRAHGVSKRDSFIVALFVEELGTNFASYGRRKPWQSAEIHVTVAKGELILRFRDNGVRFNMSEWFELLDPKEKHSHYGIRILVGMAKSVTYSNNLKTNNIMLKI